MDSCLLVALVAGALLLAYGTGRAFMKWIDRPQARVRLADANAALAWAQYFNQGDIASQERIRMATIRRDREFTNLYR